MTTPSTDDPTPQKPLRLWPGVAAVALQWLVWLGVPRITAGPEGDMVGALGAVAGGLIVALWWAFFSRAPRFERWSAILLMVGALAATRYLVHESISTAGMGVLFFVNAVPVLCLVFVAWAVAARHLPAGLRRPVMVATILLACGAWTLVRTYGVSSWGSDFAWRWAQTPEERLLAEADEPDAAPPSALPSVPAEAAGEAEWPGFRGPRRDGVVRGVRIATDWTASPPVELWRRPVGPGWSSFAVHGERLYTQEQRGDDEAVSCYDTATGETVWRHLDPARFWESNAGAGPRATPTLAGGRVVTLGATGLVNVLDAEDGAVVWSRDAAADTGAKTPYWGFSGSPLVTAGVVVVAASGALSAYDLATGEPRWTGPAGGEGYSSPLLVTIDGVAQVLQLSGDGLASVAPADGATLWEHEWKGYPIVQPALTADGDVLLSASQSSGTRRLAVDRGAEGWTVEERWTSIRLKPYFNDFVVHRGHAYGFDGTILACIDVADGQRRWKGGRYGNGQLVLLADQDVLLVVSEKGELALVRATPEKFEELARIPALDGKTWNHPVVVGDLLLVRNDREMVAYRLADA